MHLTGVVSARIYENTVTFWITRNTMSKQRKQPSGQRKQPSRQTRTPGLDDVLIDVLQELKTLREQVKELKE